MSKSQTTVEKVSLIHSEFKVNGLIFIPADNAPKTQAIAIFSHGYTSSKTDLLSWATRLSDIGILTVIFDLPGHYLGGFEEVNSFDSFKNYAHELFSLAMIKAKEVAKISEFKKIILGGHSLGGLLALKASDLTPFNNTENDVHYICVGLGINPNVKLHLFDSEFYQKTLNIRKQLVSPSISPDQVFPWIKDHKHNITIKDCNITLLCGLDDIVVGKGGAEYLKSLLQINHNQVELIEPSHLPHHEPALASGHLNQIVKKLFS